MSNGNSVITVAGAISQNKKIIWFIFIFSAFVNIFALTSPIYMMQIYDRVLGSESIPTLVSLTIIGLVFISVSGALDFVRGRLLARLGVMVSNRLSAPLIHAAHQAALQEKTGIAPGAALQDLDRLRHTFAQPSLAMLFDIPFLPIFLFVMWLLHPMLAALAVAASIVLLFFAYLNDRILAVATKSLAESTAKAKGVAAESIADSRSTIAMGMSQAVFQRWTKLLENTNHDHLSLYDRSLELSALSRTFRQIVQILVLGLSAILVLQEELLPSMIIAASVIAGRALAPMDQSISQWRALTQASAARGRIDQLLQFFPQYQPAQAVPDTSRGDIQADNITAQGDNGTIILRNISFKIPAGSTIGVIGRTGAGKSTLIRALLGAQPITNGQAIFGGLPYVQWPQSQFSKQIGYLSQDASLLNATIAENISRFDPSMDTSLVISAAKQAGVHEDIQRLKEGYETRVGRSGNRLAAGLRQRIAIARALYGSPRYIVLDEPYSNLDQHGELALQVTLQALKDEGKTVVVVAHRANFLGTADLLLVLEDGKSRAFGPKKDVLAWLVKQQIKSSDSNSGNDTATNAENKQNNFINKSIIREMS